MAVNVLKVLTDSLVWHIVTMTCYFETFSFNVPCPSVWHFRFYFTIHSEVAHISVLWTDCTYFTNKNKIRLHLM